MLSIANISSSGAATHYFEKDDYYLEGSAEHQSSSEWFGKGAEALKLSGEVEKKEFKDILDGNLPNGVSLGRTENDKLVHAAGIDLTFSAPKSVSIQAQVHGDKKVMDAHRKAVIKTLSYIEKNLIQTRKMVNGELVYEDVSNITASMFRHDTSRNQDPQLHTHCVLANAVRRDDGEWRSAYFGKIFDNKKFLGQVYRSELAYELKQQGYDIRVTGNNSTFELENIPKGLIEVFSSRAKEIGEAAKEYDSIDAKLKAELTLKTRVHKQEVDKEILRSQWQETVKEYEAKQAIELSNQPPQAEPKTRVFSYLEEKWQAFCNKFAFESRNKITYMMQVAGIDNRPAEERAVEYALKHLSERASVWKGLDLQQVAMGHSTGYVCLDEINTQIGKLAKEGSLLNSAAYPGYLTTKESLAKELETIGLMKSGKGKVEALYSKEEVREYCKDTHLNKGQVDALELILTSNDRMVGVQGYAGVGKTYMMQHLRSLASKAGYELIGMAPSSSAAKNLQDEAGIKSQTIHSFLFKYDGLIHGRGTDEGRVIMRDELKKKILLLDEASLASTTQLNGLAKICKELEVRVVQTGDTKQIDAVEAGKPFYQLQRAGMETAKMDEIIRQKDPNLRAAVYDTIDRNIESAFKKLADNVIEGESGLAKTAVEKWLSSPERKDTIIIAPSHGIRKEINQGVRDGLKKEGILNDADTTFNTLLRKGFTEVQYTNANNYNKGDVVLFNRRYSSLGIDKGEYLTVKEIRDSGNVIVLLNSNGKERGWQPDKVGGNRRGAVEVFERSSMSIQPNEQIRFTRNNKAEDIINGRIATVSNIDKNNITLMHEGGEVKTLPLRDPILKHTDNVYASTIHAAQGQTAKHVIGVLEAEHPHLTNQKLFYVTISRAKVSLCLITDDKDKLQDKLVEKTGERVASTEHQGILYGDESLKGKENPMINKTIKNPNINKSNATHKEPASLKPSFKIQDVYNALYKNLAGTYPEFGFVNKGNHYVSTTERKVDGSSGKKGKVYVYANNPGVLVDFTRGNKSVWDYTKDSYMPSGQNSDVMQYLISISGLGGSKHNAAGLKTLTQAVPLTKEDNTPKVQVDKKLLGDIDKFAKDELFKGGEKILNYLKSDRQYDEATIKAMGLGSIQSKKALGQYLRPLGWDGDKIKEAYKMLGLIGNTHNLVIPYKDAKGDPIGFAARNINYKEDDKFGKYMYSRGLSKGETLFNMHNNKSKDLIVVEGVFDCLHANAKGMDNVVALGGTGFNNSQLKLVENAGINKITLCLDNDKAGQEAGQKMQELISRAGSKLEVTQVNLPTGIKDPDQLIKDKGIGAFKELVGVTKNVQPEIKTETEKTPSQTINKNDNIVTKDISKSKEIELDR
jgi:conjugative relaxase-like TrwC/TraI family protein